MERMALYLNQKSFPLATPRYALVQSLYWLSFCTTLGFLSVYLLSRGFVNAEIGILLALTNIMTAVAQPTMAAFVERSRRISLKNFISVLVALVAVFSIALLFSSAKWLIAGLMSAICLIIFTIQPLINAVCFQYMDSGAQINYGVARGLGSAAYAAAAVALGALVNARGAQLLPVYYVAAMVLLFTAVYTFAPRGGAKVSGVDVGSGARGASVLGFVRKYKMFFVYAVGSALVLFPHSIISSYMYQIVRSLGGDSVQMGMAASIAAAMEIPVMFAFAALNKKVKCENLLIVVVLVFLVKHLLTYLSMSVGMFYATQILQIGAYGLYVPASVYYVNRVMDQGDQVVGQSVVAGAFTLAAILSSAIGGVLLDYTSVKNILLIGLVVSVIGSVLMIGALKTPTARAT